MATNVSLVMVCPRWAVRTAERAGVTAPTVSYLESGRRASVSLESARRIANALGISIDRLIGDSVIGEAEAEDEEPLALRV
jgi:transcriptional regulator with XRE-family HTH domain